MISITAGYKNCLVITCKLLCPLFYYIVYLVNKLCPHQMMPDLIPELGVNLQIRMQTERPRSVRWVRKSVRVELMKYP